MRTQTQLKRQKDTENHANTASGGNLGTSMRARAEVEEEEGEPEYFFAVGIEGDEARSGILTFTYPLEIHIVDEKGKPTLEDSSQLNQVAKEGAKHFCALEICSLELRLVVRGYADSSAFCRYNVELSERRVQWVVDTLKNSYGLKLDPKSVQPVACGKSFADEKGLCQRDLRIEW